MAVYQEKDKKKWTKDKRKWYYRVYYTDMYGNRKQKVSKMFKTSNEAKEAESQFLVTIKTADEFDLNISFEDVFNEWLLYKKQLVKYSTFYSLKLKMVKHVYSSFKNFKLHSIKSNTLLNWKQELMDKKELNDDSVNKVIGYFQEFLEYARINYNFDIKIANRLQKNRVTKKRENGNDAEWNFWTPSEFNTFIDVVDNEYDKLMYDFMYYTGLRIGETTALCWKNVNFNNKTILIEDNLTVIEQGGFGVTDTKTRNSNRIIDLDDELVNELKKHYENEKLIHNFDNSMFVFGNVRHTSFTTFRRHLYSYIEKCGIKRITPHGFRHSHVSLLINLGCDSREVASRIGDTVEMVERTYYHMFPEKKSNPVKILNKLRSEKLRGK